MVMSNKGKTEQRWVGDLLFNPVLTKWLWRMKGEEMKNRHEAERSKKYRQQRKENNRKPDNTPFCYFVNTLP